jgi:hypothetical protein
LQVFPHFLREMKRRWKPSGASLYSGILSLNEFANLENWAEIKSKKRKDVGEYLKFIDDDLPEKLKGKKDACGNVWDLGIEPGCRKQSKFYRFRKEKDPE